MAIAAANVSREPQPLKRALDAATTHCAGLDQALIKKAQSLHKRLQLEDDTLDTLKIAIDAAKESREPQPLKLLHVATLTTIAITFCMPPRSPNYTSCIFTV